MTRRYRSRYHPDNGVTYIVVGDHLVSSSGIKYGKECWDWSDLEEIEA